MSRLLLLGCAAAFALGGESASGVIVAGGDGTQNTAAPADDFGLERVARVGAASGVYLGNGWILTGYHVVTDATQQGFSIGATLLAGQTYFAVPGSGVRLKNGDGTLADLALFQIAGVDPALTGATLASGTPQGGDAVVLAGYGRDRQVNETHWNVDANGHWFETAETPATFSGYRWESTRSRHWGPNHLALQEDGGWQLVANDGYGVTTFLRTRFEDTAGNAQAAEGDSGGGLFYQAGGGWALGGLLLTLDDLAGQPPSTAVFGDYTYAADLSVYRGEILAIIPEPGVAGLLLMGLLPGMGRLRRAVTARAACPSTPPG